MELTAPFELTATDRTDAGVAGLGQDRAARFDAFVTAHHVRAARLAFRLVGADEAAAEEVAQEALPRAHASQLDGQYVAF